MILNRGDLSWCLSKISKTVSVSIPFPLLSTGASSFRNVSETMAFLWHFHLPLLSALLLLCASVATASSQLESPHGHVQLTKRLSRFGRLDHWSAEDVNIKARLAAVTTDHQVLAPRSDLSRGRPDLSRIPNGRNISGTGLLAELARPLHRIVELPIDSTGRLGRFDVWFTPRAQSNDLVRFFEDRASVQAMLATAASGIRDRPPLTVHHDWDAYDYSGNNRPWQLSIQPSVIQDPVAQIPAVWPPSYMWAEILDAARTFPELSTYTEFQVHVYYLPEGTRELTGVDAVPTGQQTPGLWAGDVMVWRAGDMSRFDFVDTAMPGVIHPSQPTGPPGGSSRTRPDPSRRNSLARTAQAVFSCFYPSFHDEF